MCSLREQSLRRALQVNGGVGRAKRMRVMMYGLALALMSAAVAPTTRAETIVFEAYELQASGDRKLLKRGVRTYSPNLDVRVVDRGLRAEPGWYWSKSLWLFDTFELEASVFREERLEGFGLLIQQRGNSNGFSWEWFDKDQLDVFSKLQGLGRLRVAVAGSEGKVELAGVEFLDDVVFRYKVDVNQGKPGTHTHEIVIKKGSVFRFPPPSRPTKE